MLLRTRRIRRVEDLKTLLDHLEEGLMEGVGQVQPEGWWLERLRLGGVVYTG